MQGLAGSGKSSALAWAAGVLWKQCDLKKQDAVVPIFVSLPTLREPVTTKPRNPATMFGQDGRPETYG